jgi:23S rRNA C2498 (ribose-2'-O)-methylase RlmM
MELAPDVEFLEDIRLFIHRPHGLLNEAAVNKVIAVLGDLEAASHEPFNRFLDTLRADAVDLNFNYILHVSLFRRVSYGKRPPVKSAILATDATIIHYGRLHAVLTQGSSIKVRIFQDRNEAAWWLGVPVERLVAKSAPRESK